MRFAGLPTGCAAGPVLSERTIRMLAYRLGKRPETCESRLD